MRIEKSVKGFLVGCEILLESKDFIWKPLISPTVCASSSTLQGENYYSLLLPFERVEFADVHWICSAAAAYYSCP